MSSYEIQTNSGQLVDLFYPNPDSILIGDIAKGLSIEARFHAQTNRHYSVGHHSILMCGLAPFDLKLEFLLHDAEEAYWKDLSPQAQAAIGVGATNQYKTRKKVFQKVIRTKFLCRDFNDLYTNEEHNFIGTIGQFVKIFDQRLAVTERNALFSNPKPLYKNENTEPYSMLIFPEPMVRIEEKFLGMFEMYRRDKKDE